MSTTFTFEKIQAGDVSEAMLAEAARLFSSSYGVWGPLAEEKMGTFAKQGRRVKMSTGRLQEQSLAKGTDSVLVRALAKEQLAGYAFATRWNYEGRQMCWVTQLCVDPEFRRMKLATKILLELRKGESDHGYGILSSHPAAIMAALRAFGRGLEEIDLQMVREHARAIMDSSPVEYVKTATLRGDLYGADKGDGSVSCASTHFFVDHTEPLAALEAVKESGLEWPLGTLPEGCEFLVLVKSGEGFKENTSDF